jgi:23S rRNA (cytosine1962-C5)-methyltransferase
MKRIILKPGEEARILAGHPWVFDNEVAGIFEGSGGGARPAELIPGELADVESSRKQYLGRAFVNPRSKIIARIYSPSKEGVDTGFFKRRIREALRRRELNRFAATETPAAGEASGMPGGMPGGAAGTPIAGADIAGPEFPPCSGRLLFGEADFLPGLIIDRFTGWPSGDIEAAVSERPLVFGDAAKRLGPPSSWLVLQLLIYGIDSRREQILSALEETLEGPAGIFEKSGAKVRELEGLPLRAGVLRGSFPAGGIVVFENGLPFLVNPAAGQKTGHFFDQRENRLLAARYGRALFAETSGQAAGAGAGGTAVASTPRALDICAYTGGFAIHAARLAREFRPRVTAVDVSREALETLKKNAALNGVADLIDTVEADAFEFLRARERQKEKFDLVILDPPAFAKSRPALREALRGYREINLRALKLLKSGGILVSCSCSQALDEEGFRRMIRDAAADAEVRLAELEFRRQGADHPVLVGYDESRYLKCGIYRVIRRV